MVVVTCAIIEKDGKILLARRAPGKSLGGKWEFPGGKVKNGESPEECLKRELEEEFGIRTRVGKFITSNKHDYSHIAIDLVAFQTEYLSGDYILKDHDKIEWIKPDCLLNFDLAEADIPIAREVVDHARYNPRSRRRQGI